MSKEEIIEETNEALEYAPVLDELLHDKADSTGQSILWLLTYKTHVEKSTLAKFLQKIFLATPKGFSRAAATQYREMDQVINKLAIAHEYGDKTNNYEHTHVAIQLQVPIKFSNMRTLDYNGLHPHIKAIPSKNKDKAIRDTFFYLTKEDEEAKEEIENLFDLSRSQYIAKLRGSAKTVLENVEEARGDTRALLGLAKKPSDVPGLIAANNLLQSDQINIVHYPLKYKWQHDIIELLLMPTHEGTRDVIWVYDDVGGSGKTNLSCYAASVYPERVITLSSLTGDVNYPIAMNKKFTGGAVMIDIPRDFDAKVIPWGKIEQIQNGFFQSNKYAGATKGVGKVRVIILANFIPEINRRVISHDKPEMWVVEKEWEDERMCVDVAGVIKWDRWYKPYDKLTGKQEDWVNQTFHQKEALEECGLRSELTIQIENMSNRQLEQLAKLIERKTGKKFS